jgi:hypothetical protein
MTLCLCRADIARVLVLVLLIAVPGCTPALQDRRGSAQREGEALLHLAAVPAAQLEVVAVASRPVGAMPQLAAPERTLAAPHGEKVAHIEPVQQGLESATYHIRVTGPGGGDAITVAQPVNLSDLAWSPDGSKLAYCEGTMVQVVDSDGLTTRRLYVGPGGPYPGGCFELTWSDDGRRLSFIQVENVHRPEFSNPVEVVLTLTVEAVRSENSLTDGDRSQRREASQWK